MFVSFHSFMHGNNNNNHHHRLTKPLNWSVAFSDVWSFVLRCFFAVISMPNESSWFIVWVCVCVYCKISCQSKSGLLSRCLVFFISLMISFYSCLCQSIETIHCVWNVHHGEIRQNFYDLLELLLISPLPPIHPLSLFLFIVLEHFWSRNEN